MNARLAARGRARTLPGRNVRSPGEFIVQGGGMTIETQGVSDIGYFAVGFEPMDRIHREFHDLLVALGQPGDQGEILLSLHEHLLRHCAQEERWMLESRFPACACHQREHEMLLEVVAEVRRRFDAGDSEIVARLAHELPEWFEAHANAMDASLAVHLRNLEESRAAGTAPAASEAAAA
jgi:hemerythrin